MRKVDKVKVQCSFCGKDVFRYPCLIKPNKSYFCNKDHKNKYQIGKCNWSEETKKKYGETHRGENNNNFGNKWNDDLRKQQSKYAKKLMEDPDRRYRAGSANRGKKFSKELIKKMHGGRTRESYICSPTEETKKIIGKKSAEKWTDEFKIKFRKTMEDRGRWPTLDKKTNYEIYFKEAAWIERMFNHISKEDKEKLKICGVYNMRKNKTGLVRDHKYGRKSGFENNIFPEILRHPCNCKLISMPDNVRKRHKDMFNYGLDNSIPLEELIKDIKMYKGNWIEHQGCLDLIEKYEKGEKWKRKK